MSDTKKHSTAECLDFALNAVRTDPNLIKFHITLNTNYDIDSFNQTLWPGVFDPDNWTRLATRRPAKTDEDDSSGSGFGLGFMGGYAGTDKVVRTYENDLWDENSRKLIVTVTESQGELEASWEVGW